MLQVNCPVIVKRSDLAACVQRNIARLKEKRANPPAGWVHKNNTSDVCVVCQEIYAGTDFCGEDDDDDGTRQSQEHRCADCGAFFCNLCADVARESCPSCETPGNADAVPVEPRKLECKCIKNCRKTRIPEGHVLAVQPLRVSRNQLRPILEANEYYIHRKQEHTAGWKYHSDSQFCVMCLEYMWTYTSINVDCVYADCAFTYCMPCVNALGLKVDEYGSFTGNTCPTCSLGIERVEFLDC